MSDIKHLSSNATPIMTTDSTLTDRDDVTVHGITYTTAPCARVYRTSPGISLE